MALYNGFDIFLDYASSNVFSKHINREIPIRQLADRNDNFQIKSGKERE